MPSKTEQYKDEPLVQEALELRDLHMKLKDLIHTDNIRHQTKVPTRKDMISTGTVYTKVKDHVVRLCKTRDKKVSKASSSSVTKLRVVRVDDTLAKFLRLKERNLPADVYPDTLVTSYFTDWVARTGRQNGREVKLNGPTDEFVQLFGNDLKRVGSGPTTKNSDGTQTKTAVLDSQGKQINPFNMNKHMFIFASHYPQKAKQGKYEMGREVLTREEHPQVYDILQKEHELLTGSLKDARQRFKVAQENLAKLQLKKDKALQVGDRTINDSIFRATDELKKAKMEYVGLLKKNELKHSIV